MAWRPTKEKRKEFGAIYKAQDHARVLAREATAKLDACPHCQTDMTGMEARLAHVEVCKVKAIEAALAKKKAAQGV